MIILLKGKTANHHPAQVVCLTLCKPFSLYKTSRTFSLNFFWRKTIIQLRNLEYINPFPVVNSRKRTFVINDSFRSRRWRDQGGVPTSHNTHVGLVEDSSDWLELDQRGSYSLLVGLDLTSRRAVDFLVVLQTGRRLVSPEVAARRPVCVYRTIHLLNTLDPCPCFGAWLTFRINSVFFSIQWLGAGDNNPFLLSATWI